VYWLQAASVSALGLDEFALRLPSALAALAWIFAIARFVSRRLDAEAGALAAWIAATCIGVTVIAHAATADALLNALLAAAMFDAWRFIEDGNRSALRRTYVWIGLGVLTKGPIAAPDPGCGHAVARADVPAACATGPSPPSIRSAGCCWSRSLRPGTGTRCTGTGRLSSRDSSSSTTCSASAARWRATRAA